MNSCLIEISDVSEILGVSRATVANWIKSGRIFPSKKDGRSLLFEKNYILNMSEEIKNSDIALLKSRRNKNYSQGASVYKNYIPQSDNLKTLNDIIDFMGQDTVSDNDIAVILSFISLQLIAEAFGINCGDPEKLLPLFLKKEMSFGTADILLEPLTRVIDFNSLEDFRQIFSKKIKYINGEDILGFTYMSLKNLGDRKKKGAYYTPYFLADRAIRQTPGLNNQIGDKAVYDPCCGTGNFLIKCAELGLSEEQIFGSDIDKISIYLARINIALTLKSKNIDTIMNNISIENSLSNTSKFGKANTVVSNPPWGYAFSFDEKNALKQRFFTASGCTESFDIFLENAVTALRDTDIITFVLPESIVNVKIHSKIRKIITEKTKILSVSYCGESFSGVYCPSVIITLKKDNSPFTTKGINVNKLGPAYTINTERETGCQFNFHLDDTEYSIIKKIENTKNCVKLKNNCIFGLGIVTGDNKRFLSCEKTKISEPILRGKEICQFYYNEPENYIDFKNNIFQQTAPIEIYRAKEKIIYRFISENPIFAYDDTGVLTLNSCNMLIPKISGLSIKYILAILNSNIIKYYLRKKYNSVKLLRHHIEDIPIPNATIEKQSEIIALVDIIIKEKSIDNHVFFSLNNIINELYNFKFPEITNFSME